MTRLGDQVRTALMLLREGRRSEVVARLRQTFWSQQRSIGLRRDLAKPRAPLPAPVPFEVRRLEASDVAALLDQMPPERNDDAQALRRCWIENGLNGCHVAVLKDGRICFMQWLLSARDNDQIRFFFGDHLPELASDTVMVEGAYTLPVHRRLPVMPAAMDRIAMRARDTGARWAVVFIGEDNTSMIKAAQWAGFVPYAEKWLRWRFFRGSVTYRPLSAPLSHPPAGAEDGVNQLPRSVT